MTFGNREFWEPFGSGADFAETDFHTVATRLGVNAMEIELSEGRMRKRMRDLRAAAWALHEELGKARGERDDSILMAFAVGAVVATLAFLFPVLGVLAGIVLLVLPEGKR